MYKYLVCIVLLSPLIGIISVEKGSFAASVGVFGYPNGASFAYTVYALTIVVIALLSSGQKLPANKVVISDIRHTDARLKVFSANFLLVNVSFFLFFLFGFGAVNVWAGEVGKGEFRVSLGTFGAIPSLMTKFILPAFLAYSAALYLKSSKSWLLKCLLGTNFVLLFMIGASWGFKATAFIVLLPALLVIYWQITIWSLLKLGFIFLITIVIFFYRFDAHVEPHVDIYSFLLTRITVMQGDVAWYIWDKYITGQEFPNYWPTLLAVFGGKILSIFGLSRSDFFNWIHFHYDLLITYMAEVPLEQIMSGHSVTATPFAEGLVAGGVWGIVFFSIFGGLLVGRLYAYINRSIAYGYEIQAAIASTYFCFYVYGWLNGGAIVQLFHISNLFAILFTIASIKIMSWTRKCVTLDPPLKSNNIC